MPMLVDQGKVSLGLAPQPLLSVFDFFCNYSGNPGVAGVSAPAFVERLIFDIESPYNSRVSLGLAPQPLLSDLPEVCELIECTEGVAGVSAPAFVEGCYID